MAIDKENTNIVSVLVPYPVDKAYSYGVDRALPKGSYVLVPLGPREVIGVVWDDPENGADKPKKLKNILHVFEDVPPMPAVHRQFLSRLASYTMSPLGNVLKMAMSVPRAFDPPPPVTGYTLSTKELDEGLTAKRRKVIEAMEYGQSYRPAPLARQAGCSVSVIKTLAKDGFLREVLMDAESPCSDPNPNYDPVTLNEHQQAAAQKLNEQEGFSVSLLDGVTGSGKTEVYFSAVSKALREGKQVLILLPEIALSNAFLDRFEDRYGCAPALWHSDLTPAQRRKTWRAVAAGESKVVIGARSALMLPFANLGCIIVDEEHDPSYKQEEGVIYNARDMAVLRAALGKILCVLVSATPSMETMHNVKDGRYQMVHLPARFGGALMPDIHLIDMKEEREDAQHFLSQSLKTAMEETLERGEQALLFLNRRGYAPLTLCRHCGHRYECDRCTAWLVEHKSQHNLQCHHCGYVVRKPKACPECGEADSLVACGPGVERIFDEVQEAFPEAKSIVLSSDTADDPKELKALLKRIVNKEIDIIIGTQIIAKGHHFPKLTCVGVVDADLGLTGGDLRATERTWQLLHQVSGRAGRAEDKGHVYLQTYYPDNKVMLALQSDDREGLIDIELMEREGAFMPPFSRLVGIIISGHKEQEVIHFAQELARCAPYGDTVRTLGPAPAPLLRLRNKYRYRFLVVADKKIDIQKTIKHWTSQVKLPSKLRLTVDIDPYSFL